MSADQFGVALIDLDDPRTCDQAFENRHWDFFLIGGYTVEHCCCKAKIAIDAAKLKVVDHMCIWAHSREIMSLRYGFAWHQMD